MYISEHCFLFFFLEFWQNAQKCSKLSVFDWSVCRQHLWQAASHCWRRSGFHANMLNDNLAPDVSNFQSVAHRDDRKWWDFFGVQPLSIFTSLLAGGWVKIHLDTTALRKTPFYNSHIEIYAVVDTCRSDWYFCGPEKWSTFMKKKMQ